MKIDKSEWFLNRILVKWQRADEKLEELLSACKFDFILYDSTKESVRNARENSWFQWLIETKNYSWSILRGLMEEEPVIKTFYAKRFFSNGIEELDFFESEGNLK